MPPSMIQIIRRSMATTGEGYVLHMLRLIRYVKNVSRKVDSLLLKKFITLFRSIAVARMNGTTS